MKVIFHLKGALEFIWRPLDPKINFYMLVKAIRGDGHFLADNIYIQGSEIVAINMDHEEDDDEPNVQMGKRKRNTIEVN